MGFISFVLFLESEQNTKLAIDMNVITEKLKLRLNGLTFFD